jgi:hypothetical protein
MSDDVPVTYTYPERRRCRDCDNELWGMGIDEKLCATHQQAERDHDRKLDDAMRAVDWLVQRAIEQDDKQAVEDLFAAKMKLLMVNERRMLARRVEMKRKDASR